MPLYFAYGSNMDEAAMRKRCPMAKTLGRARLARHRFVLMGNGYASVHRDPRAEVHGLLYDIALSDVSALDRYEDVAGGLYTKLVQPVLRDGDAPCQALMYVGTDPTTGGRPPKGYIEAIIAAARAAALPAAHVALIESLVPDRGIAARGSAPTMGRQK